ncbi:hypothetical protein [Streptomyces yunnanensis]|uniref:hypothetical protein n=1 Tax=Streptomyces yunnanensis TaxID=156453 RepID=UPI001ABFAC0C|nr:hypothetical protein [Streptomyces yunnanensis]
MRNQQFLQDDSSVSASSTWTVDWTGTGQSGQLTKTRDSAVNINVGEVQVLN